MLIIKDAEVRELLKMDDCISLLKQLFDDTLHPQSELMIRQRLPLPSGSLQVMGGVIPNSQASGLKTYLSIPGNKSPQMVVILFGTESAEPLAIIGANALGQIRTGAISGVATNYMANPSASTVSIIGSGFQASSQLEAICKVRDIEKAFVYSSNYQNRNSFAEMMRVYLDMDVIATNNVDEAVNSAEIICTITNSINPVFDGSFVNPGTHINAAGSNSKARREIDKTTIQRSNVIVVDDIQQAQIEAGDLISAENGDAFCWQDVLSLRSVVSKKSMGRYSEKDITLFESQGIGTEDVISAMYVYHKAIESKLGEKVNL